MPSSRRRFLKDFGRCGYRPGDISTPRPDCYFGSLTAVQTRNQSVGETLPSRADHCPAEIVRHSLHIPANVRLDSLVSSIRNLHRGQHVYRQSDPATDVYFLLGGALKAYRVSLDGQEGVVRFYYPNELVWTDGTGSGQRAAGSGPCHWSRSISVASPPCQSSRCNGSCRIIRPYSFAATNC